MKTPSVRKQKKMKTVKQKPMNARLEWRGRRLMLNGIMEIAFIYEDKTPKGPVFWWTPTGREFKSEAACRRSANRRFGIKETE